MNYGQMSITTKEHTFYFILFYVVLRHKPEKNPEIHVAH